MQFIPYEKQTTMGVDWKGRYVRLGVGTTGRTDNKGTIASLPKGSIGYVVDAMPASLLVAFGQDLASPPRPADAFHPITHPYYKYVMSFTWDDWRQLKIERSV